MRDAGIGGRAPEDRAGSEAGQDCPEALAFERLLKQPVTGSYNMIMEYFEIGLEPGTTLSMFRLPLIGPRAEV
jgi:hypothetical protein